MLETRAAPDALSLLLESVTLRCTDAQRNSVTAAWESTVPAGAVSLYLVERGILILQLTGVDSALRLVAGDMAMLSDGRLHELTVEADSTIVDGAIGDNRRPIPSLQGDDSDCAFIRAQYDVGVGAWNVLESVLPVASHYRVCDHQLADVTTLQKHFSSEAHNNRPGAHAITHRYAELLLFASLRIELDDKICDRQLSLGGLLDPDIGPVLQSIHGQPDKPWSVASLAREASMSRSTFAARFRGLVGTTPLEYLTEYRIQCARDMLQNTSLGIKQVAKCAGYKSPSAFSSAFKRRTGIAPADFRAHADVTKR